MRRQTLLPLLLILSLAACGPIVVSPITPTSQSSTQLPDLVVSSVYLGMQGIPGYPGCVPAYAPYEIRAIIENRGTAPAANILVIEQSTSQQTRIGTLPAMQRVEVQIPLSPAGSYTVVVDPRNTITESNESNNVYAYLAPTPTPPVLCTPTKSA